MYTCMIHKNTTTKWCEECKTEVPCGHQVHQFARFKDLVYHCLDGEKTVTLFMYYCNTCGKIFGIQEKGKEL